MSPIGWVRSCVRTAILRRKFPSSQISAGAVVDHASVLAEYSVLFHDAALLNSSLGAYSYVQSRSVICNAEVGGFCSIASNVNIGLANHPRHMVSTSPVFFDNTQPLPKFFINHRIFTEILPRTVIGADVWIGQGAIVKAGITIGTGAIIGAGAVVTKDIPPYIIAAGNPCRTIRPRFPEPIVQQLLDSRWWELEKQKLAKLAPSMSDVENFLLALQSST